MYNRTWLSVILNFPNDSHQTKKRLRIAHIEMCNFRYSTVGYSSTATVFGKWISEMHLAMDEYDSERSTRPAVGCSSLLKGKDAGKKSKEGAKTRVFLASFYFSYLSSSRTLCDCVGFVFNRLLSFLPKFKPDTCLRYVARSGRYALGLTSPN